MEKTTYSREKVWIRQPLSSEQICLPIATVNLKGPFGHIQTNAAVISDDLDQGRYILGNRMAFLIENKGEAREIINENQFVNSIQTQAQAKEEERLNALERDPELKIDDGETVASEQL